MKQVSSVQHGNNAGYMFIYQSRAAVPRSPSLDSGRRLPLQLFYKHSTQRRNRSVCSCTIQTFKSKIFIDFIFSSFCCCLLKIVLQVLASFDIKITIVCKMLTMKQLIRIQAGRPIWML